MEKIELTRKAFEVLEGGMTFDCTLRAYEGGACGAGWDEDYDLKLSQEQLLYLISQQGVDEKVFEGMKLKAVDVDEILYERAKEGACVEDFYDDCDYDDEDEEFDIEERIDSWDYSGESEELEYFLKSWKILIDKINAGEVTEENLSRWLEYFESSFNFVDDIDTWAAGEEL